MGTGKRGKVVLKSISWILASTFGAVVLFFISQDDVWIISKSLSFNKESTFIASSVYYGPSSSRELEIVPIRLETRYHLQRKGKNAFHS